MRTNNRKSNNLRSSTAANNAAEEQGQEKELCHICHDPIELERIKHTFTGQALQVLQ